jgi:membrane-bound lytic murein transglycosylase A
LQREQALRLVEGKDLPLLIDDGSRDGLRLAARRNLDWLRRRPAGEMLVIGSRKVSAKDMASSLSLLLTWLEKDLGTANLAAEVIRHFDLYESIGGSGGDMLVTGYFVPEIPGSLQRSAHYPVPVYGPPKDLVKVRLDDFGQRFAGVRLVGRLRGGRLEPFPSRREIRQTGILAGREIAWAKDPVDLFFVEVQGSGILRLPDGEKMRFGYAGSNGQPYRSIGKLLIEDGKIEREKVSMQSIRAYLEAHPEDLRRVLDHNPSTVFFRPLGGPALGSLGIPVTSERSIATDHRLFPRGALAFLASEVPTLDAIGRTVKAGSLGRFVFNQDTGGAIRGPGRVDFFWGTGPQAAARAGAMKQRGRLFFLAPKERKAKTDGKKAASDGVQKEISADR